MCEIECVWEGGGGGREREREREGWKRAVMRDVLEERWEEVNRGVVFEATAERIWSGINQE